MSKAQEFLGSGDTFPKANPRRLGCRHLLWGAVNVLCSWDAHMGTLLLRLL